MSLSKWLASWRYVSYMFLQVAPFSKRHSSKQIWQVKRSFASCPNGPHTSKQISCKNSLEIPSFAPLAESICFGKGNPRIWRCEKRMGNKQLRKPSQKTQRSGSVALSLTLRVAKTAGDSQCLLCDFVIERLLQPDGSLPCTPIAFQTSPSARLPSKSTILML